MTVAHWMSWRGGGFLVGYAMCIIPCCLIEDSVLSGSVTDRGWCSSPFWPPHSTLVRFSFKFQRGVDRVDFVGAPACSWSGQAPEVRQLGGRKLCLVQTMRGVA